MLQLAQENPGKNEQEIIDSIIKAMIARQEQKYQQKQGSPARRDLHSKSHGTVQGRFIVTGTKQQDLSVGLFAKPNAYEALVRFSNGKPGLGSDILPDVRGLALKIKGVPGNKLLPGQENSGCHDFLLANHQTNFIRDLEDYKGIGDLLSVGDLRGLFSKYPADAKRLIYSIFKLVKNPLRTAYFSQTPYLFGNGRAVKYALFPVVYSSFWQMPNIFDSDYLRHALEDDLKALHFWFFFCVQFQTDPVSEPIEDSTVRWKGQWHKIAELHLPCIGDSGKIEESFGEGLVFNPWRALEAHRPLGWINRVRKEVYSADARWRTSKNT